MSERFILASDSAQIDWGSVMAVLGQGDLTIGRQMQGFGSTVYELLTAEGQGAAALRVPIIDDQRRSPQRIWANLRLADKSRWSLATGAPGLLYMVGIDEAGKARQLCMEEELPDDIQGVAEVLEILPEGMAVAEVLKSVSQMEAKSIYRAVGAMMAKVHQGTPPEDEAWWRNKAAEHLVDGNERLAEVLPYLRGLAWVDQDLLVRVEAKTRQVVELQVNQGMAVRPIHGDWWEANWWWSQDKKIYGFDQALGYGPVGWDMGFAMGRQLIAWIVSGDMAHKDLIEELLYSYEEQGGFRDEAMAHIYPALVFKLLVGAAFDHEYDEPTRQRLLRLADKLLDEKLADAEKTFRSEAVANLWQAVA